MRISNSVLGHEVNEDSEMVGSGEPNRSKTSGISVTNAKDKYNMATYNLGHSKGTPRNIEINESVIGRAPSP